MNAFLLLFSTGLLALADVVYAAPPPIEQAPADVDGYIRCIQDTYAANRWQAGTIANCRSLNPAVRALREGDYVAVTFTGAQNALYQSSRKRWIDFDKSLRVQLLSKQLGLLFQAANPLTAHSFEQVSNDLNSRFAELDEAPFSWYPASKTPYVTANGLTLASLHNAELAQFARCMENSVSQLDRLNTGRATFDNRVVSCRREITVRNNDGSSALFQPQAFDAVSEQLWNQIAAQQATAHEAERQRLAKEEAESWPNRLQALTKQALAWLLLLLGVVFIAWKSVHALMNTPVQRTGSAGRRELEDDDEPQVRPAQNYRREERKPDLGTFTLKHRKISALTTKHMCASCCHWTGPRTKHPVTNDMYVKLGAAGKCVKKTNGSPYGMKRYDEGFYCKDFSDIGF
ncbi:hypothetical protein [Pseudomonas putida]|uniref:hypothetical protein n=1 Tax=Pseudomonas putida TaxID=303 RepID=UPI0009A22AFC|nr:hypothetical protein [Pseudomonas putida]